MDIEITFINQSNDPNMVEVVIFQKNVANNFDELAVAWRVIESYGKGSTTKFRVPSDLYAGFQDSWGNMSNLSLVKNGQRWMVMPGSSGDILILSSTPAPGRNEIEIMNDLSKGTIDAQIYRDEKLLATQTGISPQQKAVFEFKPTLWVGVASQVVEGEVMNSAILSNINTEISLIDIKTADLVMTGGGPGPGDVPFAFSLIPTS